MIELLRNHLTREAEPSQYLSRITPCSSMVRPRELCPRSPEHFSPDARKVLAWSRDLKEALVESAYRGGAPFNREKLITKIQSAHAEFKNISPLSDSCVAATMLKTLTKLQHYVAMRPLPYVLVWLPDFGRRIESLGALLACQCDQIAPPPSLLKHAFGVDAERAAELSKRDMLLYNLRILFKEHARDGALSGAEVRSKLTTILQEVVDQSVFSSLPSSRWARVLLEYLPSIAGQEEVSNLVKDYLDLFSCEARMVRNVVPSNIWGTKLDAITEEHFLRQDRQADIISRHLLWLSSDFDQGEELRTSLSRASARIVSAYRYLFPAGLVSPVLCFEKLPEDLKREIILLQLFSRQAAQASNDRTSGLRNPDTSTKVIDELEARNYVTMIAPTNNTVFGAFQVQFNQDRFSKNERSILECLTNVAPELRNRCPVFVRLTIVDPRDNDERRILDIKPYEQLLDATFDRALARGIVNDPRKMYLFAIVRKTNPALHLHLRRGWKLSSATFVVQRQGKDDVEYNIISHAPQ